MFICLGNPCFILDVRLRDCRLLQHVYIGHDTIYLRYKAILLTWYSLNTDTFIWSFLNRKPFRSSSVMTLQSSRHTRSENFICLLLCQSFFFFISNVLEGSFSSIIHSTYWISHMSISSGHRHYDVGYTHTSQSG